MKSLREATEYLTEKISGMARVEVYATKGLHLVLKKRPDEDDVVLIIERVGLVAPADLEIHEAKVAVFGEKRGWKNFKRIGRKVFIAYRMEDYNENQDSRETNTSN